MTNKQTTVALTVLVVILGIAICVVSFVKRTPVRSYIAGAAGNLLIEDYDPYVKQNGGIYTNLDIKTSADLQTTGTLTSSGAVSLTSSLKLGSSGTAKTNEVITTCNPIANTSIAATSTGYIYCTGVTGVTSADYVFASFATSTNAIGNQWAILGTMASTTAGAIDIKIMNLTGAAVVPSVSGTFASSTRIHALH